MGVWDPLLALGGMAWPTFSLLGTYPQACLLTARGEREVLVFDTTKQWTLLEAGDLGHVRC